MKILLAYDGSSYADDAIRDLGRAGLPSSLEIHVVCVANGGLPPIEQTGIDKKSYPSSYWAKLAEAETLSTRACEFIRSLFPQWKLSADSLWGDPAAVVLAAIERGRPDLLVVGSHGRSAVGRLLLGSVSLKLVHEAPCSVRVVKAEHGLRSGPIRIVVGDDGSSQAKTAVREVAARSWPEETKVRVVSLVETLQPATVHGLETNTYATEPAFGVIHAADVNARLQLEAAAEDSVRILRHAGLDANAVVVEGDPKTEVVAEAKRWDADAIFVGDRGLGKVDRLILGSVSTAAVTHAGCVVEVVRRKH
jgi:nucleotide-binding universal stress UspA family protein